MQLLPVLREKIAGFSLILPRKERLLTSHFKRVRDIFLAGMAFALT